MPRGDYLVLWYCQSSAVKGIVTICVFAGSVEEFLAPVKSTICYGKYIYLFKQNP